MITDSQLAFVPIGANLSLVGGAGVGIPSNVIDFLGLGVGVPPGPQIWGNTAVFGQADAMGVGNQRPELNVSIGTLPATANAATLNVQFQGAIDTGAAGNYLPGTWNTFAETGPITVANMAANLVIARFPYLPPFPANLRPRFLRLLFSPAAATNFTAGTIASALVVMSRDDWFEKYAAKNYSVA